ncbi:2-hydroxychromene-2-carboxylate isomerase/DsbA-like thioredoxin domain [Tritonibacter mobilis]|uniref:DsbA family oxidoreductase n=1 Tax=Tritonibacter mobilis TaxID=379347 RepID=UPI000F6BFABD|nr:DsbA family oxidoreductase [Tritonibacter mobilis]VCU58620.1 2-hydroxychromene-2-carboxylate isomerase/DsbA-like thioredoxin domain [Tritonibacter mobilis]
MTQPLAHVKLDILSDPICPWCYIGKTHLDRALADAPDHPFVVEWHPFQLNPDMPEGGMDRRTYLETKFGGKDNAVKVYAQIADHAREAGVEINFEAMQRTPNTIDAHRLIHWAGLEAKQSAIVDALFQAYFVDGKDIGDTNVLADLAEHVGMERAVVEKLLEGDSDIEEIRSRDAHSRKMGVNSVPTFIIANQHVVPGAQQPELWAQVIADIRSQLSEPAQSAENSEPNGSTH